MAPPDDDNTLGVILYRQAAMEARLKEIQEEMRGGFASLAFVGKDVYEANKNSASDFATETRRIAENARTVAWATASFVIVAVGFLLTLIKAVAK